MMVSGWVLFVEVVRCFNIQPICWIQSRWCKFNISSQRISIIGHTFERGLTLEVKMNFPTSSLER